MAITMGPITVRVEIDLPRSEVFAAISDLARRPSFTEPYQSEFRLLRLKSTGIGAGARFRAAGGWMSTEIVEIEAPYRLLERGRCGRVNRIPTTTAWELIELPAGLTEVSLTFATYPTNLFDRANELRTRAERRHRRGWQGSLNRLREQLESEFEPASTAVEVGGQDRLPRMPTGTLAAI